MQIGLFDGRKQFKLNKPIRLIELFGGIGCQAKALENLEIKFEHYRMCDFDKYAVQSYNAVHGTDFVRSDITKITAKDLGIIETNKYDYIMTYSFPCTDLSIAGKCAGMSRDSGTRSGLLWEVERLLKECKQLPQVLLMENVPQVHGKGNIDNFNEWCLFLESKGYKNYWKDLNAKNYGIPQNRNRTFMVSLLGDYCYEFPKSIELKLRLKDMLEDEVDEKYYLSDKMINLIPFGSYYTWEDKQGNINTQCNRGCNPDNISLTIPTIAGHTKIVEKNLKTQLCNKLIEENRVKEFDVIRHSYSNSRIENQREIAEKNNISPTLDTRCDCLGVVVNEEIPYFWNYNETKNFQKKPLENIARTLKAEKHDDAIIINCRIRKLTPKECWRLMGLSDTDFDKAKASGVSNSQLYKQAGNGIVVNVLMAIFKNLI